MKYQPVIRQIRVSTGKIAHSTDLEARVDWSNRPNQGLNCRNDMYE